MVVVGGGGSGSSGAHWICYPPFLHPPVPFLTSDFPCGITQISTGLRRLTAEQGTYSGIRGFKSLSLQKPPDPHKGEGDNRIQPYKSLEQYSSSIISLPISVTHVDLYYI